MLTKIPTILLRALFFTLWIYSAEVIAMSSTFPEGFTYLETVDPTITQDIRYATANNFLGRPIKGYLAGRCILTRPTALALAQIQKQLQKSSLSLKVFDCYRPQQAVNDFIAWSRDVHDQKMQQEYYPNVNKADFFKLGYVAEKSGHTRGSTVDLTLINIKTQQELDMGTPFDFMDELSHPLNQAVSREAYRNRMQLRNLMLTHGFQPIPTEWWHFTLADEPYKEECFDFPVK